MSGQPWETHDPLCPNRRPTVAFPNSACSGCRAVVAARAEGRRQEWVNQNDEIQANRDEGYAAGVQAARDAVEQRRDEFIHATDAVDGDFGLRVYDDALAGIDALVKEKP